MSAQPSVASFPDRAAAGVGIGLRQPHYQRVLDERPALGFVEVHAENFFADGGAALGVLQGARRHYPVSLHGVGLGLGSAAGLDPWHLDRLERLVERIEPVRISDHAAFGRVARAGAPAVHANDLLPIAFTEASLDILVRNVSMVQERLRRAILVENVSAYLSFAASRRIALTTFTIRLLRSSSSPQPLRRHSAAKNAGSSMASSANDR